MKLKRQILIVTMLFTLAAMLLTGCGNNAAPSDAQNGGSETQAASSDNAADATDAADESGSSLPNLVVGSFSTEDLNGNPVTESIFAEKEYTMINVWATYCGPCINEMPELEKLYQSLPENMQIIGVVCDFPVEVEPEGVRELADEIVGTTGVTYPSLRIWQTADWFYATSNVVPTTYFVDSEGRLVSDIIYGADLHAYQAAIEKLSN